MTEIKKCPFCGGEARTRQGVRNPEIWFIDCAHGCMDFCRIGEEEAIEAWNTRYEHTCDLYVKDNYYHCDRCDGLADPNESFCAMCGSKIEFSGETKCKVIEE